jgi:hypothetical protein
VSDAVHCSGLPGVHHRELHRSGDEAEWRRLNIDPVPVALRLWQRHGRMIPPALVRELSLRRERNLMVLTKDRIG